MSNNQPTIILADDDEDDQEILALAFNRVTSRHNLSIVNNGQEVLDLLEEWPSGNLPCLIILDLNMPVLDGQKTLQILHNEPKYRHIPKIIFTTSWTGALKENYLAEGAVDYLIKPANLNDIVDSAEKMLKYCRH